MSQKSNQKKAAPRAEKSFGTEAGEKVRAKSNSFSDEKRAKLMEQGMALIYGDYAKPRVDRS